MKKTIAILSLLLLLGCANSLSGNTVVEQTKKMDASAWTQSTRVQHPDWFTCSKDEDCVLVAATCGSNCRGEAINANAYSDYTVAFSNMCQGTKRFAVKCESTERSCVAGMCAISYS